MTKLKWKVTRYISVNGKKIPVGEEVPPNPIRTYSPLIEKLMPFAYNIHYLRNYLICSGFIHRIIGKWMRENIDDGDIFLDIGCGNMELRRQLPKHIVYNAFDISFSEYCLGIAINSDSVNIAIASATKIPLDSNQVSFLTATEVLEHIPEIDRALDEIRRIAIPNALFLLSIPNNHCHKYHVKGPHEDHCNNWTYNEFISFMKLHGFDLVKGCMKGWWIPFPLWLTKHSYQLPISSDYEYFNTNFFFMFRVVK